MINISAAQHVGSCALKRWNEFGWIRGGRTCRCDAVDNTEAERRRSMDSLRDKQTEHVTYFVFSRESLRVKQTVNSCLYAPLFACYEHYLLKCI